MEKGSGPAGFKAGFVAIAGLPNAGKSTLLNTLCGFRLSIVSPRPQTTRDSVLGILNGKGFQAVFIDTPGMLSPRNLFEKGMAGDISRALNEDADLALLITEPRVPPPEKHEHIKRLAGLKIPLYLLVNKIDQVKDQAAVAAAVEFHKGLLPDIAGVFPVSALNGDGLREVRRTLLAGLPEHPPYYPTDQSTDRWERFYAGEIVREELFRLFSDEVPYCCAVEVDHFREEAGRPDFVHAVVHVSRPSLKPILLGAGGRAIRKLRENSRAKLEKLLGRPADLELTVKVTKGWENDPVFLKARRENAGG
ncbi:MAG TPA: GTPase Era [Elusimicrobiales bacterium]|nr:GTPase Era [Elusimicrobiales bacterium]